MVRQLANGLALATLLVLGTSAAGAGGPGSDSSGGSGAQERLDRDLQRAAERAAETDVRFAEERAKIEERAVREPAKAAEDLAKLEEDRTRDVQRAAEDAAKAQEDFAESLTDNSGSGSSNSGSGSSGSGSSDDGSSGSSEQIRDLGASEGAEHDGDGYAVRRGELVGIDLTSRTLASATARGFRMIDRSRLESLGRDVVRLAAPRGMSSVDARRELLAIDPKATVDLVHYYGLNLAAGSRAKPVRNFRPRIEGTGPITVGMIDTAITRHDAIAASRVLSWQAGVQRGAPVAHGTAVASLIVPHGRATIYSANIFRGPAGRPFTSADVIAQALDWMLASHVPVINMSLAGPRNAILDRLVADALARGQTIVAAAGNGGPTAPPAYPAAVPGVVAVTAVDGALRIYRYANRGRYITVAAKGVDVVAANSAGGFAAFTGTSFATPHIAGWLARCRSSGATTNQCITRLRQSARDIGTKGFDEVYGFGFVD